MKTSDRNFRFPALISLAVVTCLILTALLPGVIAEQGAPAVNNTEASYDIEDTNPAIYVAERNANSVVGVITNVAQWNSSTRETVTQTASEGSGVVIAEGGYVITNYHVVSGGDSYQILMPDNTKVEAELTGYDRSYDLAVLKVSDEDAKNLTPAAIGSTDAVKVGSTVVAIGNPGGETLSSTVTCGIISCLARNVNGDNTTRTVDYIQHDASISNGNSGGGLFDINGNLIGINTLKYAGSANGSYEGLGFAIPVNTAWPIACQLIEHGKVLRLGLGVTIREADGAEEPTEEEIPSGLFVTDLVAGGPAEEAGILKEDFIIAIDGERVHTTEELTDQIDKHQEGDTVKITVVRYTEKGQDSGNGFTSMGYQTTAGLDDYFFSNPFDYFFGSPNGGYNPFGGYQQQPLPKYDMEIIDVDVTLKVIG